MKYRYTINGEVICANSLTQAKAAYRAIVKAKEEKQKLLKGEKK